MKSNQNTLQNVQFKTTMFSELGEDTFPNKIEDLFNPETNINFPFDKFFNLEKPNSELSEGEEELNEIRKTKSYPTQSITLKSIENQSKTNKHSKDTCDNRKRKIFCNFLNFLEIFINYPRCKGSYFKLKKKAGKLTTNLKSYKRCLMKEFLIDNLKRGSIDILKKRLLFSPIFEWITVKDFYEEIYLKRNNILSLEEEEWIKDYEHNGFNCMVKKIIGRKGQKLSEVEMEKYIYNLWNEAKELMR